MNELPPSRERAVIGPFPVCADPAAIAAWCALLELAPAPRDAALPYTYPICWLAMQPVHDALTRICGAGALLLQETQRIAYRSRPRVGRDYVFGARIEALADDDSRLALLAEILERDGTVLAEIATHLRVAERGRPVP